MTEHTGRRFTVDNWGYPPQSRKSFQQVQSLFPTARLCRGPGPITTFNSDSKDIFSFSYEGADESQRTVQKMLADSYTDAFIVMKENLIVCEHYENGMAADSFHLLNSVTKSFVGMLAGILISKKLISETDLVIQHIPELAGTAFSESTIRHLLDMTAPPKYGEDYADPSADFWVEAAVVAIGIHGQVIYMNMQTQVVIVKLSTHPEPASALFQDSFVAMRAISEAV